MRSYPYYVDYWESLKIMVGHTNLGRLCASYGWSNPFEIQAIWRHPMNAHLPESGSDQNKLKNGDLVYVPISVNMIPETFTREPLGDSAIGAKMIMTMSRRGRQFRWVQTVHYTQSYSSGHPDEVVDAVDPTLRRQAPGDVEPPKQHPDRDEEPFYYKSNRPVADSKREWGKEWNPWRFEDAPQRMGTAGIEKKVPKFLQWRAVLSIGIKSGKRVTLLESKWWGFDFDNLAVGIDLSTGSPRRRVSLEGPRPATSNELGRYLKTLADEFRGNGWTFRLAQTVALKQRGKYSATK